MPPRSVLPGVAELDRMLGQGMTQTEIAKAYGVTKPAVSLALKRHGREARQVRHWKYLPWRLGAHSQDYNARMLRLAARIAAGEKITPNDLRKFQSWREGLQDSDDGVVMFIEEHVCNTCEGQGGLHVVPRQVARKLYGEPDDRFDTELIFVTARQGEDLRVPD